MSGEYCVDANIFITAWLIDYPPHIFKSLWEQIPQYREHIALIKPVFDEIDPIAQQDLKLQGANRKEKYPLRSWIEDANFSAPQIYDDVNVVSLKLELEYETTNDSRGAGPVDITLIAYAKVFNKTIVTFEKPQAQKPVKKCDYKIPLICREQKVKCIH